jgi:tetratricopeptide (TPR) repeat protein
VNRDPGNSVSFDIQNDGILGEMLLYAGRGAEAETLFSGVLGRLGPATPQTSVPERRMRASAHYGIALARGDAATDDDTLSHLRAAADAPDADLRRDALDRLGASLMSRGDPSGAAAAYRTALEADASAGPGTFARQLRLAEALHAAGQPAEALRAVQEALGGAPAGLNPVLRADAHYGAALIYLREIPDRDQAAAHLREVLRLNPAHPRADWIRQTLTALGPAMEGR